jgi:phosphoglycerol transferase MdoB-like AlkP superfamily enzyme
VIGLALNGQEVTPTLNRLTTNSYYFSRFFPQTSLGSTSDAEFCVMNSLLPARNGVVARQYLHNTFRSLPAILREHEYQTISMSVCRPNLWNMGLMHRAYGFQHRYYYDHFARAGESPLAIPDDRFLARARETLRRHQQPFFAHLMTISSHTPFTRFPKERRTLRLGEWEGTQAGDYLQAVHFVDGAIQQFLAGLAADGLASNSVIVIYGDHPALPDEDWTRFKPMVSDVVGTHLDEALRRRVPAFMVIPGVPPAGTMERPAGQIDIAPSVLHLLGVRRSESFFLGQNLFKGTPPLVYFRTGAFLDARQFSAAPVDSRTEPECVGIQKSEDRSADDCRQTRDDVRKRIELSDSVLELDLIPILADRFRAGRGSR